MKRAYLDYAATAPLLPAAREAMTPWLDSGNPSSLYEEGRNAKAAIDEARETISNALSCLFAEVIFTSGATEAAALAILGTALANPSPTKRRVLMGAGEHHCVLNTRTVLEKLGYAVELIPLDSQGRIDLKDLEAMLSDDVLLTCAMHANNELGTISDISSIAAAAHAAGSLMFVDAVQSFGIPGMVPSLQSSDIDLLSVTSHKIGGPKGAGALFIRAGAKLRALTSGGGQERELRGGTENVAAIVGFAAAVKARKMPHPPVRDTFAARLQQIGAVPTVSDANVLPSHLHVRFPGIDGETLVIRLDRAGVSASSGAACSSGSTEASHVLLACGYSQQEAREGVRFTFGPAMSVEDALDAAERVVATVAELRSKKN